jgi:hypothetical protein
MDQLGAVLNQAVAPFRVAPKDRARYRKNLSAQLCSKACGDERARSIAGLYDHYPQGKGGNQAVAPWEVKGLWTNPKGEFRNE